MSLRGRVAYVISVVKRKLKAPPIPRNADGTIRLHIGCGGVNSPGFINIDARGFAHVHVITSDLLTFADFETSTVDMIYMCHVLEHLARNDLMPALREMRRGLKTGGILRISVPDFERIMEIYVASGKDVSVIEGPLMGKQDHQYNCHHLVFDQTYRTNSLTRAGFTHVKKWDPHTCQYHDFVDGANKTYVVRGRHFPISLNLEAVK